MLSGDYQDYARLRDRDLIGDTLTAQEHALLGELEERDPHCATEGAVCAELDALIERGPVGSDATELVSRVLAAVDAGALEPGAPALDEQGGQRERRGVGRTRATVWAGAVVLATAAVLLLSILGGAPEASSPPEVPQLTRAELVHVAGSATLDGAVAQVGGPALAEGSMLTVDSGTACIAIDPGIDVCLGPGSAIRLASLGADRRVEVVRGRVIASLDAQPHGESFSLTSGVATLRAVGTVFAVSASEAVLEATVIEGEVKVEAGGASALLKRHQRALVGDEIQIRTTTRADESRWRSMLPAAMPWREQDVAILRVTSEPVGATVYWGDDNLGLTPLSSMVGPGAHALRTEVAGHEPDVRQLQLRPAQTRAVHVAMTTLVPSAPPPAEAAALPSPAAARRPPSAETLLTQAQGRLVQRNYRGAAQAYSRLVRAHPDSPEAHAVLVGLGDVQLRRLSRPKAAVRSYARYLREGGGPLAQEARLGIVASHRAMRDPKAERAAIEDFLQFHARSQGAAKLRTRLAELGS